MFSIILMNKMIGAYIVICVSFGLAHTLPVNYVEPVDLPHEIIGQDRLTSTGFSDSIQKAKTEILEQLSKDVLMYPDPQYNDVMSADGDVFSNAQSQSPYVQDSITNYEVIQQDKIPMWGGQYQSGQETNQALYEDQEPTKLLMDIEEDNYDDSDDNALPNPVLPLDSLPYIYSTYVHETVPSLDARGSYDIDVLNPENTELQQPNMRPTRSRGDDFMTELAHETIMNNIIPTMSYVRGAEEHVRYPAMQSAVYPSGAITTTNGCGTPILLVCNPRISHGSVVSSYPQYIQPQTSASPYRGDLGQISEEPNYKISSALSTPTRYQHGIIG